MIYHIQTFCTYGYWPEDLSYGSGKPILAACDRCNRIRITSKKQYRSLCVSCAVIKRFENPIEREKQSERTKKRFEKNPMPNETKEKMSNTTTNRWKDPEIRERTINGQKKGWVDIERRIKYSENRQEYYSKMDDPGQEIVGHHIAYDFDRPEAFIIYITRKEHGQIHHPKGQPISERGYSLID